VVEVARADKLISVVLEGGIEDHEETRGWVDPDDDYHPLKKFEVHHEWVHKNPRKSGLPKGGSVDSHINKMYRDGWIRVDSQTIDTHGDHRARAANVRREMKLVHNMKPKVYLHKDDGPDELVDEGIGHMTRGWVDPQDNFHGIGKFEVHNKWAVDNIEKTGVPLEMMRKLGPKSAMLKAGWLRVSIHNIDAHKNHQERARKFLQKNYP
jgi:hypothetical protein